MRKTFLGALGFLLMSPQMFCEGHKDNRHLGWRAESDHRLRPPKSQLRRLCGSLQENRLRNKETKVTLFLKSTS